MKNHNLKLTGLIIIIGSFLGCTSEPFTGYIVHKEYVKAHWSNEEPKKICESNVLDLTLIAIPDIIGTSWVKTKFKVWVANREKVRTFDIDSLSWFSIKCGDKVTYDISCGCIRK